MALAFHHIGVTVQLMDRTRQLPVELWEQIIRTLDLSFRPAQKQPLVELTHLCWSLAVAARPTLYRRVFVSSRNVDGICARVDQDADAFRTWTRGLWILDPVPSSYAKVLRGAFQNITAFGGDPYTFVGDNSGLLRPRLVALDFSLWPSDWQQVRPANHPLPLLAHAKHLHFAIFAGAPLLVGLPAEIPVAEVVVVDVLEYEIVVDPESFISLVRAFLKARTLRQLHINLDSNARKDTQVLYETLADIQEPRITLQYAPMAFTFAHRSISHFLHSRHLDEFEIATA